MRDINTLASCMISLLYLSLLLKSLHSKPMAVQVYVCVQRWCQRMYSRVCERTCMPKEGLRILSETQCRAGTSIRCNDPVCVRGTHWSRASGPELRIAYLYTLSLADNLTEVSDRHLQSPQCKRPLRPVPKFDATALHSRAKKHQCLTRPR